MKSSTSMIKEGDKFIVDVVDSDIAPLFSIVFPILMGYFVSIILFFAFTILGYCPVVLDFPFFRVLQKGFHHPTNVFLVHMLQGKTHNISISFGGTVEKIPYTTKNWNLKK